MLIFLINKINEFDLDFDDVKEESEMIFGESKDINSLIYTTFDMSGRRFLDEAKSFFMDKELNERVDSDILDEFEMNIFTNYLDSSFNSKLDEYNIVDFSEENLEKFLCDIYEDENLCLDKEEFLEKIDYIQHQLEISKDDKEREKNMQKLKKYAFYNDEDISSKSLTILDDFTENFDAFKLIEKKYENTEDNSSVNKSKNFNFHEQK